MMKFESSVVENTVNKLMKGEDYREEIVNAINVSFLDFTIDFFKKIIIAKFESKEIDIDWYKKNFICNNEIKPEESVINAGLNKKTVTNIYGSAKKEIMLEAAELNYDYLSNILRELEKDSEDKVMITIKISYKEISVELNLSESLIVMNTLATKKIALRGGAWSSIGKRVEKPLLDKLCLEANVLKENINNEIFIRDKSKDFDREVDYKLISKTGKEYRIEVKLMGRGNPESADATIARDSDIFIADTLSEQNKAQLKSRNIKYLELKNNNEILKGFKKILLELDIPYTEN